MNNNLERARVLVAEDEPKIATLLIDYLRADGFDPRWISHGDEVLPDFKEHGADAVLLDIMMPGRDGIRNCQDLRAISDVPILMVTARVEEVDRLIGLNLGADDYICKPFSPREVVARVKTILRRTGRGERRLNNGPFKIDEPRVQVMLDDQTLALTSSEFRLLTAMISRPGVVFSRDQLLDLLGEEAGVANDRAIDSHIKNLRKKLAKVRPGVRLIESVYGEGYKLGDIASS